MMTMRLMMIVCEGSALDHWFPLFGLWLEEEGGRGGGGVVTSRLLPLLEKTCMILLGRLIFSTAL